MAHKQTKKVKKTASEKPKAGVEIGASGTNIFSGIIREDYNPKLSGTTAIKTYDEMRKSDGTVKAALLAIQLPIRRAEWFVSAASEDKQDQEIKEFVSDCLFNQMSITWDDFIRQALLNVAYGVMVFEKVFDVREINGVQRIVWKKLAPRLPRTITAWQMTNGEDGITQSTTSGTSVNIPMEKLLVFNNEKEGDNWWGVACLRAAYKHWYIKSTLEKIDAVAHERQGLGLPFVKLPPGATEADTTAAKNILSNMRAQEDGYLIEPDNVSVEFKDMKSSGIKDASRAIDYHDRQILKSVLAQFLALGSGASGSYALSRDHSTLFLQSIEAVANGIVDVINKYAIPQLVDLNFNGVKKYPKLDYSGISATDVEGLSTAYQRLVQTGGIKPIEADEEYMRKILGLPERTEEDDIEPTDEEPENDKDDEDLGIPDDPSKKKVENSEKGMSAVKKKSDRLAFLEKKKEDIFKKIADVKLSIFREQNDFKSWRKLTFAEKKVNFSSLQAFLDKTEAALIDDASTTIRESTDEYIRKVTDAVNSGDSQKIKDLEMPYWAQYKKVVKSCIVECFAYGKNNASREMDIQPPSNPQDIGQVFDMMAENIATQHFYKIETEARQAIGNQLTKFGEKEIKALAAAVVAIATSTDKLIQSTASIIVAATINKGRKYVFEKNADKIYALQRSEILDEATCNFCVSLDGRIVEKDDEIAKQGTFHSNCRGIWVEILKDEEELPEITGVPESLRDRLGDDVNELVQPKKPLVRKDSLAAQAIAKGKAGQNE